MKHFLTNSDITSIAVKAIGKWSVYIVNQLDFTLEDDELWSFITDEIDKFFSVKTEALDCKLTILSGGLVFFETREEAMDFYSIFNNKPVYSSAVYAELFSSSGEFIDENT